MAGLYLGIDIGSYLTKVCVFEQVGKFSLIDAQVFPTPFIVSKDGQSAVDSSAFVKQLSKYVPLNKLRSAKFSVNLQPLAITVLPVFMPLMSPKELVFAAVNEARQKMLPPSGPNHIFQTLFVGETIINKIPRSEVLVIRTEKIFIQEIINLFKPLEVFPHIITPTAAILPILVEASTWKKDEALAIVDIGTTYLKISICSNGHMAFVRNIIYGIKDITNDLARQLSLPVNKMEEVLRQIGVPSVSFDPNNKVAIAEEIMRQKYEASLAGQEEEKNKINELELRLFWQPHLEKISQELRRSVAFYQEQSEAKRVTKICFIGGGSILKNLVATISTLVNIDVEPLDVFKGLAIRWSQAKEIKDTYSFNCLFGQAVALGCGLALPKSSQKKIINFIPPDLRKKEQIARIQLLIVAVTLISIGVSLLIFINLIISNQNRNTQIRSIAQKLSRYKSVSENLNTLEQTQARIEELTKRVDELTQKRLDVYVYLRTLAAVIPKDMFLTNLKLNGFQIELEAVTEEDYETAIKMVKVLKSEFERSDLFETVEFQPFSDEAIIPTGSQKTVQLGEKKERTLQATLKLKKR
ncbi:MAG: pilus assembly protein PilM [Candidatus Omnitrophica bacterium]|nr:pilus assembly protein PilM [Candidatus Omnitrophota bacterium]